MKRPLRILLVEDSEDDALFVLEELRRGGFAPSHELVTTAEAMTAALAKPGWDLVISDYTLPGFSGLHALELFKKQDLAVPFILVSGNIGEELAVEAMRSGANDYVMKQNLARLVPAVKRELAEAEQHRQHRQAEKSLLESEALFRSLSASSPVGIFLADMNGQVIYVNPRWRTIHGLSLMQSVNEGWIQTIHPDDREWMLKDWVNCVEAKRELYQECRILRPDGVARWVEIRSALRYSDTGETIGFVGTVEDITRRKQMEDALRASEVRFRDLFEHSPDAIFVEDAHGTVLDMNRAACQLHGLTREQLLGKNVTDLVPPDKRAEVTREFPQWFTGKIDYHESLSYTGDGRSIPVELRGIPIQYHGQPAILFHVRNITKRKQAEESNVRLATAIEQSADGVMITDAGGAILYVNPAFEKITGYTRKEAIGQNPRLLKSGKHDAEFYRQMWAALTAGEVWSGRFINKKKDGTFYEEDATISPVRDAAGKIVNYVAVKKDITHEVALEAQLRQVQKMDAVGKLAAGVAHDFNNLLNAIIGFGELTLAKMDPSNPLFGNISQMKKAGERAAGLTRQLLAFSRKQILEPKILDLNVLIADLHKMLDRLVREDIEIVLALSPATGRVKVDPGQIEQVITNMVVNARDAMPHGGKLTIETRNVMLDATDLLVHPELRPGGYVRLSVRDTGTGMTDEVKARIFEPFFTTKSIGQGTGLGLATCAGAVQQSGGYITVESKVGEGTIFHIYLPRVTDTVAGAPGAQTDEILPRGQETILLVEDELSVRQVTELMLADLGYKVFAAADGEQALHLFRQNSAVDLLVTDVVMPKMNGKQVADELRRLHPRIKVLFISGYTDDAIVHHGVIDPGIAFLQKPFLSFTLARKVREILDKPKETPS